jgi:hypothetical protein
VTPHARPFAWSALRGRLSAETDKCANRPLRSCLLWASYPGGGTKRPQGRGTSVHPYPCRPACREPKMYNESDPSLDLDLEPLLGANGWPARKGKMIEIFYPARSSASPAQADAITVNAAHNLHCPNPFGRHHSIDGVCPDDCRSLLISACRFSQSDFRQSSK